MPELRTDWLTGRSVIVAENRALRPNEFELRSSDSASRDERLAESTASDFAADDCPFCPGNESGTPSAVYQQVDEHGHWQLRVVPNKFPAFTLDASNDSLPAAAAYGAHEVIVESSRHIDRLSALSVDELRGVLDSYVARLRHWRDHGRFAYALVFKNQGARAGASLAHLHSQLVAMPGVPPAVSAELQRAQKAFTRDHVCAYCRLIESERTADTRVIHDLDGLIAFARTPVFNRMKCGSCQRRIRHHSNKREKRLQ